MIAAALRTDALASGTATTTTATAATNGPSSGASTAGGGGPVAAPTNQAYLGEITLPAPAGEPQALQLPDGSILVPVARVDAAGNRVALTGGAGSAQLATSTSGGGSASASASSDPVSFLLDGVYYKQYFPGGGIDTSNVASIRERAIESTYKYLLDREPGVDDFGTTDVSVREVDATADRDLLAVNPGARYVIDVHGVQSDGVRRSIPSVMNHDGATYTDPRLSKG